MKHRPDSYGYGYRCIVTDVDADDREEVIIHNRTSAWVYKLA